MTNATKYAAHTGTIVRGDGRSVRVTVPRNDRELVAEANACPKCGERDMDWLWIDDAGTVRCGRCRAIYATT